MRAAISEGWWYFSLGFIATYAIYLLARWETDKIVLGAIIAAVGGVALAALVFILKRRRSRNTVGG